MDSKVVRRILIVDDEQSIVNAVRRELCTPPLGRYRFEVEGFTDPAQALERAKAAHFDVVVSDFRMPGMDGLAFLKALAQVQPGCAQVVLSGQTDMDALVKMVNETHIYRFVPKPWHDYFLKSSVAQAIDYNTVLRENRRLANQVRDSNIPLPSLTTNAAEPVLIVDDEPDILSSLSRVLGSHTQVDDLYAAIRAEIARSDGTVLDAGKIDVQVTTSPLQALKLADTVTYSCVIADFRMPKMNGIELLQRFADKQPACARILISGRLSQDDLIDAVDNAHIFGFIGKPWQDYELKACVAQALAHRRMTLENRFLADMVKRAGGMSA